MAETGDWLVVVPEATRSLVSNPSFELDTAGWATGGSNNIARTADESFKGDYGLEAEYIDDPFLALYQPITLTAEPHAFSARVFLPAGWDGGAISLRAGDFTSMTTQVESNSTLEKGVWVKLEMIFTPDAGDLVGGLWIVTDLTPGAPSAGAKIYVDAVQCEVAAGSGADLGGTTYCDGDQEGCWWEGKAHASLSRRRASSRAGGRERSLEDYFGFRVERWPGTGMAPVDNVSIERSILAGAEFQRARLASRTFVLGGHLIGDTPEDLMTKRAALVPVLSPFAYDGGPVLFIFRGREIRARYAGGMELDRVLWRYEDLNLPFLATEPRWLAEGRPDQSEALATGTLTTRLILGKVDGVWDDLGPPDAGGTYTSIRDIKVGPDGKIYVCGVFQNFDAVANADYIARYDPVLETWEAVGAPSSGATITSILKMDFAPNGDLYVVGNFTNLAGVAAADYVARYSAAGVWGGVGTPNSGATITDVQAVAYGWGNRLWVGGNFSNLAGIAAADNIAYWDIAGASWNAAGASGANGAVADIWASPFIDQVYATGGFTTIAGVSASQIAVQELGDWAAMGSGLNNPGTRVMATGGFVYVVGQFTAAGSISSSGAAYWNGEKWQAMAAGLDDPGHALAQLATGEIVVGGSFENIITVLGSDAVPAVGVGYWNGSVWNPPEFLLPGSPPTVYAAEALANGDFYVGYDQVGNTEVPSATTITNEGSAPAWPVFVISQSGGASSRLVRIENVTTGKVLTFSYSLDDGVTLWIDLRPRTLGMYTTAPKADQGTIGKLQGAGAAGSDFGAGVASAGSGGGRFFRFGPDSDVAEFVLVPGENVINLYFETGSGATLTAFVRWVEAYESVD